MKEYIKEYIKENKKNCIIDLLALILIVITLVLVNDIRLFKIYFIPIMCLNYFRLFLTDVLLSKSTTLNKNSLEFMDKLITDLKIVTQKKVENESSKEKDVNKV